LLRSRCEFPNRIQLLDSFSRTPGPEAQKMPRFAGVSGHPGRCVEMEGIRPLVSARRHKSSHPTPCSLERHGHSTRPCRKVAR
jgi:hypothetical protein